MPLHTFLIDLLETKGVRDVDLIRDDARTPSNRTMKRRKGPFRNLRHPSFSSQSFSTQHSLPPIRPSRQMDLIRDDVRISSNGKRKQREGPFRKHDHPSFSSPSFSTQDSLPPILPARKNSSEDLISLSYNDRGTGKSLASELLCKKVGSLRVEDSAVNERCAPEPNRKP
eukprot:scaffold5794_cov141-Cylindrotheca_fusiformis.AAC.7